MKTIAEANEKAYHSDQPHVVVPGPLGVESVLVSRISVDNEFLGSVFAFSYIEKAVPGESRDRARTAVEGLGVGMDAFESAVSRMRVLNDGERKIRARRLSPQRPVERSGLAAARPPLES